MKWSADELNVMFSMIKEGKNDVNIRDELELHLLSSVAPRKLVSTCGERPEPSSHPQYHDPRLHNHQ